MQKNAKAAKKGGVKRLPVASRKKRKIIKKER
jgi:hypothetical protein